MVHKIHVNLNIGSYDISIGFNILKNFFISTVLLKNTNNIIITNHTIKNIIIKNKYYSVNENTKNIPLFSIPDGESYKNLKEVENIISFLLKKPYGRDVTLIAIGGGVVGDITGFVASIYQRGVNFFQIPTTLLAQVDASIGGKTGVNHVLGKNMIGSFWQPKGVLIDIDFLSTLPKEHLIAGMAEIVKYAIIFDYKFFVWLEKNYFKILQLQKETLLFCIKKCCELKVKVVESDEKESGLRFFLNLGHSFAHAIETHTGYGAWLHGEAVSVGLVMSAYLSVQLNILHKDYLYRIKTILYKIGLPVVGPKNMLPQDYLKCMLRDKKVLSGRIRLILPISIGQVELISSIDNNKILQVVKQFQERKY
ncbi:3-dehydroquinate synthase [Buchnera aphidicola (Cinara pseudotaxifoliae)]|uniref:3-dehydroquinate synthase n=1 Tax=Buchnera aphidicola (Cinara pseudotaxifoliae) TaxID=655384 RepID=A0A451DHW7_9GAMM|nr:3-dehydroquinate synthase [Buchnera aphidicola]VFP86217.1 3-dehydroquinate synthase [Buchnera aphidicola (Cinara pseudotaxifoliae)]